MYNQIFFDKVHIHGIKEEVFKKSGMSYFLDGFVYGSLISLILYSIYIVFSI